VPAIIELTRQLKVKRFIAFNFIPAGRGADAVELDLTPEQREELLKQLFIQSHTSGIEVLSTAPQYARVSLECSGGASVAPTHFYLGEASWDLKVLADFIGGCGAGRLYCALQPNGDVSPCVFMPDVRIRNLRKERFMDIWHNNRTLIKLRDRSSLQSNCGKCEHKFVCGGCRARALAYFDDLLAPDPSCILTSLGPQATAHPADHLQKFGPEGNLKRIICRQPTPVLKHASD